MSQHLRKIATKLHFTAMLRNAYLNGGHLLGLVALGIVRIANAFIVVEVGNTGGECTAWTINASMRTIVDVGAPKGFRYNGDWVIVNFDLLAYIRCIVNTCLYI